MGRIKLKSHEETLPEHLQDKSKIALEHARGHLQSANWDPDDNDLNLQAAQVWATIAVAEALRAIRRHM